MANLSSIPCPNPKCRKHGLSHPDKIRGGKDKTLAKCKYCLKIFTIKPKDKKGVK